MPVDTQKAKIKVRYFVEVSWVELRKSEISDLKPPNTQRGSWRGWIILLHGVPGVGRTTTAVAYSKQQQDRQMNGLVSSKEDIQEESERITDINLDRLENKLLLFEYRDCEPKVMAWVSEAWRRFQSVANASIQPNEYLLEVHAADEDKIDSSEDDSSSEEFRTGRNSDGSDGSDEENKISKRGKGKELKNGSKKSKGSLDKKGKSEKKA
ncbi:hypothetical protein K449DRAFT_403829 [Hypoxylon sp. EC38]|nr:hypothetical protein K449DRAFT_403829 [Hypoxylon sp. EC38]